MRPIVVAFTLIVVGCNSDTSKAGPVQMSEDDGLRAALDVLVSYQTANNVNHYDEPIRQIRQLLCPKGPCDGDRHARWTPSDIGSLALTYAHSSTPEVRAMSVSIACGICREANTECRCEGRQCTSTDFAPKHSYHNTTLRCNVTDVNGKLYTWGKPVKEIP